MLTIRILQREVVPKQNQRITILPNWAQRAQYYSRTRLFEWFSHLRSRRTTSEAGLDKIPVWRRIHENWNNLNICSVNNIANGFVNGNKKSNLAYIDIAVDYMFAIWSEESVCHFIQTVGFNAEMFMPRAKGFLKDTKLPFKLLKLGHLPCSGNSES